MQEIVSRIKCKACGRIDTRVLVVPLSSVIGMCWAKCRKCGSFFQVQDLTTYDMITHHSMREWGNPNLRERYLLWRKPLFQYICRGLAKRGLKSGDRLLDVGASWGGLLLEARKNGFDCAATEIIPSCVLHLRQLGFRVFEIPSLSLLRGVEAGFDAITMLDVNYYFQDQKLEFQSAYELLNPGKWLVIRTTNKRYLIKLAIFVSMFYPVLGSNLFKRAVVDHLFVHSPSSLIRLLRDVGFNICKVEPDSTRVYFRDLWSRLIYALGNNFYRITRSISLAPGIIIWARRS